MGRPGQPHQDQRQMTDHPYAKAAMYQRWRQGVTRIEPEAIDPVVRMKFRIGRRDRIVTAGSCFAQHIARRLRTSGFHFLVTETAHPLLTAEIAEAMGYGIYSARTGNIYTARQLLQLWQRAFGKLTPQDDVWEQDGAFFDPYRPAIQPGGFPTLREYQLDREQHFAAVRTAFKTLDVLVFTLGLTECWASAEDGCVYPVCPGTLAGQFDAAKHILLNLTVEQTVADMRAFIAELRAINPRARLILTVSPVPLVATALDRHVLVSTTYSKSVLRVAAEMLAESDPAIAYFPSYEVILSPAARGAYFAADLRSVTEAGVDHVMRLFLKHGTDSTSISPAPEAMNADDHFERSANVMEVICEEESLDQG
jgi:hypothetical protein